MKPPRVCLGGYFEDNLEPVRPVIPYEGITEDFLYQDRHLIIKPFAIIEFKFIRHIPDPPHTEDWEIDPSYKRLVGDISTMKERMTFLDKTVAKSVKDIFGTIIHREDGGSYVKHGEGQRSLGTIMPHQISYISYREIDQQGKWDYRTTFVDKTGGEYRLAVTDLAFRKYCNDRGRKGENPDKIALDLKGSFNRGKLYLRIGLARGWKKFPDRCYLQILALHSFPDYLRGKNFSDFVLDSGDNEAPF